MSTYDEFQPDENEDELFASSEYYEGHPPVEDFVYGRHARRNIEDDIRDALEIVMTAKGVPMSRSVMVSRDQLQPLLEDAIRNLPTELLEARRALREREALMAEEQRRADNLIELAKTRAAQMIETTEIVRLARVRAQEIVAEAEAKSRKMVTETEDFLDSKLAEYEISIGVVLKAVQRGRSRLRAATLPEPIHGERLDAFFTDPTPAEAPFDYDADEDDRSGAGF